MKLRLPTQSTGGANFAVTLTPFLLPTLIPAPSIWSWLLRGLSRSWIESMHCQVVTWESSESLIWGLSSTPFFGVRLQSETLAGTLILIHNCYNGDALEASFFRFPLPAQPQLGPAWHPPAGQWLPDTEARNRFKTIGCPRCPFGDLLCPGRAKTPSSAAFFLPF